MVMVLNTLMKGDLFVLSCARVRRVRRGSKELIMCGQGRPQGIGGARRSEFGGPK